MPLDLFIESIGASPPPRVPGTAVFLTSTPDRVPHALLHNLKHNKVLHERVVFLTIVTRDIPRVPRGGARAHRRSLGAQFWQIDAYYGFIEDPDVPALLEACGRTRLRVRHDGHVVLRLARDADRDRRRRAWRCGASGCSSSMSQDRRQGDGLLPHPDQPRRRARNAGRAVGSVGFARPLPARVPPRSRPGPAGPGTRAIRPARPSAPASSSSPCSRSGGCARPTRRTRRRGPAASRGRPRAASAPR